MGYKSFEDLDVWKRACRLAVEIYEVLGECRDAGLKSQMTRAAVSVASNIAEGAERNSAPDYIRFIHMAKGSAAELRTQLYIAGKVGLIPAQQVSALVKTCRDLSAMLQALANSLKHNKAPK